MHNVNMNMIVDGVDYGEKQKDCDENHHKEKVANKAPIIYIFSNHKHSFNWFFNIQNLHVRIQSINSDQRCFFSIRHVIF